MHPCIHASTMCSIAGVLARHNQAHGRSQHSNIDIAVYCPPEVLHLSGPLFGDIEGIKDVYDAFISERTAQVKLNTAKCIACGWLRIGVWVATNHEALLDRRYLIMGR